MLLFAHRGIHDPHISENTLEAFRRALELPIDGIELDVRVSRDGELVVFHDPKLDRLAGDGPSVHHLSVKELKRLTLRGEGHIPTLNEAIHAIPRPILIDIEIKERASVEPLIRKLRMSKALRERVIVSSFLFDALLHVRKELPDIRIISLNRRWPLLRKGTFWNRADRLNAWGIGFPGAI